MWRKVYLLYEEIFGLICFQKQEVDPRGREVLPLVKGSEELEAGTS